MNTNNSGITNVDVLSVGALYVGGKRFRDIIRSLIAEDTLEQGEIDTLRTLLANLNTDGLTSEWIVNNDNRNAVLKTLITAIETKLAKIDTTALTETSVLNNDNRNSVLKTRLDTAATDIDNLENKTKYITSSTNIQPLAYTSTPPPAYIKIQPFETDRAQRVIDLFVNPDEQNTRGYNVEPIGRTTYMRLAGSLEDSLTTPQYNRIDMGTYKLNIEANDISITCNPLGLSLTAGELSVPGIIRIGAKKDDIFIGCEEPNVANEQTITIGVNGFPTKSITKLNGFLNTNGAQWLIPKSDKFGISLLIALIPTGASVPLWMFSFALGSVLPSFEYSDVFVMKDGPTGVNKLGDLTTSNDVKLKSLVIFDKDLIRVRSYPIEGTFVARGTISKTTLDGSIRNSVFLDGGGDNKIAFKHHNIAASDITEWATTEANNKINVIEIGGNSGILIHQGASNEGEPLRIIHSKKGSILLALDNDGTMAGAYPGLEVKPYDFGTSVIESMVRIGFNPLSVGNTLNQKVFGSYALEVNHPGYRDGMVVAKAYIDAQGTHTWLNVINGDSINTPGTITGITLAGGSLVISGNYTGDTTNRLYKNADGKLFWNGTELGSNLGGGGGGLEYYIPLANNVTNPAPSPTTQVATETYTSANQRTITQSTTAVNTGILMAKYATGIINKESNPFVEGLQTIQQHLTWNQNNIVGQIYGQSWFQASASGAGAFIYDRSFTGVTITNGYQVLNGVPILAPQSLFNLTFQSVTFPGIKVDTFSGFSITMKCRLEAQDLITGNWNILQTSNNFITYSLDNQENQTITFNETFTHNQTSKTNAPTAYRMVLFLTTPSSYGQIHQQTFAGSTNNDLIAYKLGSTAGNTAEIRVLLYDGVNAKQTITHTSIPSLVPIELPISPPYQIGAFNNGRLGFDIYMFQPSGAVNANHQTTFYFGDGTISHIETTINEPPAPIPTLAQVLDSGATASQPINMNTNKISGITALEGSSNGNWEVKEITAGTNIGRSVTNGNYTINNTAPVQNIVQGAGILVEINATTKTATITNTNVGATQVGVSQSFRDESLTLVEVGALPQKPNYWLKNFVIADSVARSHFDIYVSVDGQIIASASPNVGSGGSIRHSKDYGTTWAHGSITNVIWSSICGTSQGSKLFAFGKLDSSTLLLCTSINQGTTWASVGVLPSAVFGGTSGVPLASITRFRCSGDGKYLIASDSTNSLNGRFFTSTTGGGSSAWTQRLLNSPSAGRTTGVCMSRSGAVQYIAWAGTSNSAIYASYDYGATFNSIQGNFSDGATWDRLECDATGRFLYATRYSVITTTHRTWRNDNYGDAFSWTEITGFSGAEDIWVSATGQFVAVVTSPLTGGVSYVFYSSDYGRIWTATIMGTSTTFRSMNGSADGSILVIGSIAVEEAGFPGTGFIRVARSGLVTNYDRLFLTDEILWYSGVNNVTTQTNKLNLDWLPAGKIDLALYDIKYEVDINWDLETSESSLSHPTCFMSMGFQSNTITPNARIANTIWTRKSQTTTTGFPLEIDTTTYDQAFNNVFLCGYSAGQWIGEPYRYRTLLKGELSRATTRPAQYTNDFAVNSRTIMNRFNADCILYDADGGVNQLEFYHPTQEGQGQIHIQGTAFWEMAYNNLYNNIASGIDNIFINLHNAASGGSIYAAVFRKGYITYRIWRVKK